MKRIAIILSAACIAALPAGAQNNPAAGLRFGGLALNHDVMMAWDFSELARPQTFGTARATGMGGAFVSLGADMTALSLNPAGLGMYRRSEFSLTPLVSLARAETPGTGAWADNSKNRFALANIGAALNVYQNAKGSLTSVTLGIGMNRVADFNTRYSYSSETRYDPTRGSVPSIADVYVGMFERGENGMQVFPDRRDDGDPNGALAFRNPYFWPAVLGYKSAMVHVTERDGDPATRMWGRDAIGPFASILRSVDVVNSGSINEFDLSFGANINNIVYVGASLGIQSVHKRSDFVYGEDYGYFDNPQGIAYNRDGEMLPAQLDYADLWQRVVVDGSGVNFKLGVIVRPVSGLRLGMAFHTPTFYSLDRSYRAGIDYLLLSNEGDKPIEDRIESPTQYDEGSDGWEFVSPSRLMFGASYTFGNFAIVSLDYERDWYNGIRVKNTPAGVDLTEADYKADFKQNFCGTNAVRAGVEVKPLPILALRVGGGYTSLMLRDESLAYEFPQTTTSYYVTAGAGVNLSRSITLDVAYQYLKENQSQYSLFYSYDQATGNYEAASDLYQTSLKRNFITMTLGFHF